MSVMFFPRVFMIYVGMSLMIEHGVERALGERSYDEI